MHNSHVYEAGFYRLLSSLSGLFKKQNNSYITTIFILIYFWKHIWIYIAHSSPLLTQYWYRRRSILWTYFCFPLYSLSIVQSKSHTFFVAYTSLYTLSLLSCRSLLLSFIHQPLPHLLLRVLSSGFNPIIPSLSPRLCYLYTLCLFVFFLFLRLICPLSPIPSLPHPAGSSLQLLQRWREGRKGAGE